MTRYLLLALLLWPLLEIAVFIKVGSAIGVLATLGLILASTLAGGLVIRHLGLSLFGQMRQTMGQGMLPARSAADAMLIFTAGLLLLLPGFVSDVLGLLLLLPPVRELLYSSLTSHMVVMTSTSYEAPRPGQPQSRVEKTQVIDLDDDDYHRLP